MKRKNSSNRREVYKIGNIETNVLRILRKDINFNSGLKEVFKKRLKGQKEELKPPFNYAGVLLKVVFH